MNSVSFGNTPKIQAPDFLKEQVSMAIYKLEQSTNNGMRNRIGNPDMPNEANLILTALANSDKVDLGNALNLIA